jgi:hypothetical protein
MSALVFMDTETTGLSLEDDIWEFAAVRREEDGTESELHLFIEHDPNKCARLPESFRADHGQRFPSACSGRVDSRSYAANVIANFTQNKAHIVGAVPNFDTERLTMLLRDHGGRKPEWHYHLIDVETLAIGALVSGGTAVELPWDSDAISNLVGVHVRIEERHTAMGDVRWAMQIYDAVMDLANA